MQASPYNKGKISKFHFHTSYKTKNKNQKSFFVPCVSSCSQDNYS